jgi:hypothetical protein
MCLNMDRNTLWGAAGGMVFEHERSWDARDRFEWVEQTARDIATRAARSLSGMGFQPMTASTPADKPTAKMAVPLIRTKFHSARLDPKTGALISLKLGNRELLGGPANVIVAEQPKKKIAFSADHMVDRPDRDRLADSNQTAPRLNVRASTEMTVVEAESSFIGGGRLRRAMTFHRDDPRIDFETELNDIPDKTVVVAEFPLAGPVREVRRGIPYGFAHGWLEGAPSQGAATLLSPSAEKGRQECRPSLPGFVKGITPAVRWSHYQMAGAGVALLDQGLSGREITDNTPIIYLYNANDTYRGHTNSWLSGKGQHVLRYALVPHAGDFTTARVAQRAWEYNTPTDLPAVKTTDFLQISDNVIVEALRREAGEIELRLAECLGRAGTAQVTLRLLHLDAALTDMVGGNRQPLLPEGAAPSAPSAKRATTERRPPDGKTYSFPIRPQQIVTMRFKTASVAPDVKPLTEWNELVPEKKREALRRYQPDVKGHPPAEWLQPKPKEKKQP